MADSAPPQEFTPQQEHQARRAAIASFVGAVLDWYDFILYGQVAALVLNRLYFPSVSPAVGTLAAFATFGIGFLFRPLSGIIFGHFGDRMGRKRMLITTITLMGSCTVLIGLLPTYAQIGIWAPILLTVLRAIQGIGVGGEWGGATLMAVESAPPARRAFYSSGVQVGYSVGLVIATGFVMLMNAMLPNDQFLAWGWRVPFVTSFVIVIIGLLIRRHVEDSADVLARVNEAEKKAKAQGRTRMPLLEALRRHPGAFLKIFCLRLVELVSGYIVITFALNYGVSQFGYSRQFMLNVGLWFGGMGIITIPLWAFLSDKYGRRRIYIIGSAVGVVMAFPFFLMMQTGSQVLTIIASLLLFNVAHDMAVSAQQPMFTEMFGAEYRYSGAGVGYQVASAIAGGFTPFIAQALSMANNNGWTYVAIYLLVACLISGVVAFTLHKDNSTATLAR